jgi:gamma-D-glutamyl-L-lysine dipeptidyl-peptidase
MRFVNDFEMKSGISVLSLLPVRSEPSERSEMVTQLLFGECFDVLELRQDWAFIRNWTDSYEGWVTSKVFTELTGELYDFLLQYPLLYQSAPVATYRIGSPRGEAIVLPAGSRLYSTDENSGQYFLPRRTDSGYDLHVLFPEKKSIKSDLSDSSFLPEAILSTAKQFLNAPYLWGGKSVLGMDCSGLVQLAASIHRQELPRDARDQADKGVAVDFNDALPGDLAFFSNKDGRIVHVGLVSGTERILHASGCVRNDLLTSRGIFRLDTIIQTHHLCLIKRVFSY